MINALHSSQENGTMNFTRNANHFGWQEIVDMFERECAHVRNGNARMIPKLREARLLDHAKCSTSQDHAGKTEQVSL